MAENVCFERTRLGTYLLRLGGSCCPCWSLGRGTLTGGARVGGASDWIFAFGRRLVLSVTSQANPSSNEDKSLIKRTASEEAILAKRPRRKVRTRTPDGSDEEDKNEKTDFVVTTEAVVEPPGLSQDEDETSKVDFVPPQYYAYQYLGQGFLSLADSYQIPNNGGANECTYLGRISKEVYVSFCVCVFFHAKLCI